MMEKGLLDGPVWITFFLGWKGGCWTPPTPQAMVYMADHCPPDFIWNTSVMDPVEQWKVLSNAINLGGHVRVGMEDNPFLDPGGIRAKQRRARREDRADLARPRARGRHRRTRPGRCSRSKSARRSSTTEARRQGRSPLWRARRLNIDFGRKHGRIAMNMNTLIKRGGIAAVAFVAAAIAGGLASAQDKPTIYVIAPSLTDPFWITEQNGANQAGQGLRRERRVPGARRRTPATPAWRRCCRRPIAREARRHRNRLHLQDNGGGHHGGARCRHPGRALQQQPLRGRECARATSASSTCLHRPGRGDVGRDTRPRRGCRSLPKEPCKVLIVNPFPTAFVLTLRGDGVKRALDAAGYPHSDLWRPATRARISA